MEFTKTIGIIVALPDTELNAALLSFNFEPKEHTEIKSGERYWITNISTQSKVKIRVVITCLGYSGNTESQIPVERIIVNYNPELLILAGIACGIKKYKLADVVTSDSVWAYEYIKTQRDFSFNRSRAKTTPRHIQDDIQFFNKIDAWHDLFKKVQRKTPAKLKPRRSVKPELHRSIWIASGEKVLGNVELIELNKNHDLIRAGEMEGYGFATACEDRRPPVPWLIVRGISDHGDPGKDNTEDKTKALKDEYHQTAANSALTFVRVFIETSYVTNITENYEGLSSEIINPPGVKVNEKFFSSKIKTVKEFFSNEDPDFLSEVYNQISSAENTIVFCGLGHSLLKKNSLFIKKISQRLYENNSLKVDIFYCDPSNKGLRNRVSEEYKARKGNKRTYRRQWPSKYLESIQNKIKNEVHHNCIDKIALCTTHFMPMFYLIKVDSSYFVSFYGSPDIIGPESPWLLFTKHENLFITEFIDQCVNYYKIHRSECLVKNNY